MNYNYKIRKIDDFKLITTKDCKTNSATGLLEKEYPYILHSMKEENYVIEYDEFDIVQEIIDDERVVGFISFVKIESFDNSLCINEVYILPEFRHRGLFYQTLLNLLSQPNMTISLRNPNKRMIDLLIEYEFAKKLDNNIVISYVNFQVDYSNRYTNKNIGEYYEYFEKDNQNELIRSNFYDLNINSVVFFDLENIIIFEDNPIFIEKARRIDSSEKKHYSKLKFVDLTYLEVLLERLLNVETQLGELFKQVNKRIDNNFNIDDILGTRYKLTPFFEEMLLEHDLKIEDGFVIRRKVIKALKNNEIIPKSIILRTMYLINHFNEETLLMPAKRELGYDFEEKCPNCLTLNNNILEVCKECGYNIQLNNHFEEKLPEIVGEKFFSKKLSPEYTLKKEINYNENKLNDVIIQELNYLEIDEDDVYKRQREMALYQFLKDIEEPVYFDIFDYDCLNNIRPGSSYTYALKHELITELKNYHLYYDVLQIFFSDDKIRKILRKHNLETSGTRDDLILRIESNLSPTDIFGEKYVLTAKGKDFLKKRSDYAYYNHFSIFSFYEFITFRERYDGDEYDFEDSFINHMEETAIGNNDYNTYHKVLYFKLINSDRNDVAEYLILFTKIFIIELNNWLSKIVHENGEKPLSRFITKLYPEIKDLFLNQNILSIFNKANDSISIEYLKDNDSLILLYLIKSLNYEDIDDINREIEEYTFEENYLNELLK